MNKVIALAHPGSRADSTEPDIGNEQETEHRAPDAVVSLTALVSARLGKKSTEPDTPPAPDTITVHIATIEHAVSLLVPACPIRQGVYPQWVNALAHYIETCQDTHTTKREIQSARTECLRDLEAVLQAVNTEQKLSLKKTYTPWRFAFTDIKNALQGLGRDIWQHTERVRRRTPAPPDTEPGRDEQDLPYTEPDAAGYDFSGDEQDEPDIERTRAYLYKNGYVQRHDGFYGVRMNKGKPAYYKIIDALVAITVRRCVFTVPSRIDYTAKAIGTVQVTKFIHPQSGDSQILEIHRSDMLATKPEFLTSIHAVTPPHPKRRGDLIHVIDVLGQVAPVENRFNATGLVRAENKLVFLNPSGGALVPGGFEPAYQVQYNQRHEETLRRCGYGWKRASTEQEQIADYRTLLQIGDVAPGSTGYGSLLLGILAFCPMSQSCDTGGIHTIVHGATGSYKSATARLILQAYSSVCERDETSTANLADGKTTVFALEQIEHYLPGMFVLADDALKGRGVSEKEIKEFYKLMSLRGRHAAERQGRDAGTWNYGSGGFSESYYPRGSSVTTVEVLPNAETHSSELARYAVVSVDGSHCINNPLLSQLQEPDAAASMNHITAAFIQWLLPRMDTFLQSVQAREDIYRVLGVHVRTPTTYAKMETGIDALLQYGVFLGALTEQDAASILQKHRDELIALALTQKALMGVDEQHTRANNAVDLFYGLLRQALQSGKLYAADALYRTANSFDGGGNTTGGVIRPQEPLFLKSENELPDIWGWKFNESQRVYEPYSGGKEAGVLKCEPGTPVSLHMYVRDFKENIYPLLSNLGLTKDTPLPGLSELIDKLKKSGKLESTKPTNLHGRASRTGSCYVLNMEHEPETDEQDTASTEPEPAPSTEQIHALAYVDISIDD